MADVIRKAINRFTKGLVMDFSPENTKNEVLTHALNATLLTFNGNELSLQNDMGNARVETAFLPEGYMPVGTCEYGGIIYIVSYNPLEDKSQIGCFPSPERNVSNDELGISDAEISKASFQSLDKNQNLTGDLINTTQYVLLKNDNLNPGDKFLICSDSSIYDECLADLYKKDSDELIPSSHPILSLNVVSIEDSGKVVYLNSDLRRYNVTTSTGEYNYHILGDPSQNNGNFDQASVDIDSYRNVLSSGYSVFKSKTSGRLAILAELITIDSYSVTHSVQPKQDSEGNIVDGCFDVIVHTEVSPEVTQSNYNLVPKLKYYYLKNSQGYLQATDLDKPVEKTLFKDDKINGDFFGTYLSSIYVPTTDNSLELNKSLEKTSKFNFHTANTYHGRMEPYTDELSKLEENEVFVKFYEDKYHRIKGTQVYNSESDFKDYYVNKIGAKFYRYDPSGDNYVKVEKDAELSDSYTYYVKYTEYEYKDAQRDDKYKGQDLYELGTKPSIASSAIINDSNIEKFQLITTISYIEVTEGEWATETIYVRSGNSWSTLSDKPDKKPDNDVVYYKKTQNEVYISVGFTNINQDNIQGYIYYYPSTPQYVFASKEVVDAYWNFEIDNRLPEFPWGESSPILYWRESKSNYKIATSKELMDFKDGSVTLYYNPRYVYIDPNHMNIYYNSSDPLFMVVSMDKYIPTSKFKPNTTDNYISGYTKPISKYDYDYDDPISLHTVADFIPSNENQNSLLYEDIKLGGIKLPDVVSANGLDLPFKYDYTLVPCMNYGKLDHLAVSNTVDFSKLHAFNQSDFNTWKYHIDGNQLRLTFGADVFDTYETDKVDGLVLEFYDLWGFAGSLEITGKKSYSGIFTKIISLNSLGALSKQRINGSQYSSLFKRNIEITKEDEVYKFNGKEVYFGGHLEGWKYTENNKSLAEKDNDSGTLYSNLVYGVKTYLRQNIDGNYKFIPKKEFFLYTLPIFNEYYYSVNDFSTLHNPKLNLMLTYKLKDSSTKVAYSDANINEGYDSADSVLVADYTKGVSQETDINVTKYYKYEGVSDLSLEIGLSKEYQDINLSYSPEINSYYKCNLQLVSDSDLHKTFDIKKDSEISNSSDVLNYKNTVGSLKLEFNKLGFYSDYHASEKIDYNFKNYNFITNDYNVTIPIKYKFIVGYNVVISEIRKTEVPATTICALCHMQDDETYNYEDFGVYEQSDSSGTHLLSKTMFYNGGTASEEEFGLCMQVETSGVNMLEECHITVPIHTAASNISLPGKLNTGEPLKQILESVGKLTFCLPHAHGMSNDNGVNIYKYDDGTLGIAPEQGGWGVEDKNDADDTYGIRPHESFFKSPCYYNMSLITPNVINTSIFLSMIDYDITSGKIRGYDYDYDTESAWSKDSYTMRKFTGFTGSQVADFNKKLMESMKNIYAYNPDYDSLTVNVGNVSAESNKIQFTSNLINTYSELDLGEQNFNDFIFIGSISFSDYLNLINTHSIDYLESKIKIENIDSEGNSQILPHIQLKPSFEFCGTPESPYLISSLTYNTDTPSELVSELSYASSNQTAVKHHDGSLTFINGIPNKKVLYGYDNKKLIQLDVSNYEIDLSGKINIKAYSEPINRPGSQYISNSSLYSDEGYTFNYDFTDDDGDKQSVELTCKIVFDRGFLENGVSSDSGTIAVASVGHSPIEMRVILTAKSTDKYIYRATCNTIEYNIAGRVVDYRYISTDDKIGIKLQDQSYDTLLDLAAFDERSVSIVNRDGTISETVNTAFLDDKINYAILAGGNKIDSSVSKTYPGSTLRLQSISNYKAVTTLYTISPSVVHFNITRQTNLAYSDSDIIHVKTTPTNQYAERNSEKKYIVKYNKARFRGTSLTVNDLVYDPRLNGHRLCVKNGDYISDNSIRPKIYYRSYSDKASWKYSSTKLKNSLYLFTGPCFTINNLYTDE